MVPRSSVTCFRHFHAPLRIRAYDGTFNDCRRRRLSYLLLLRVRRPALLLRRPLASSSSRNMAVSSLSVAALPSTDSDLRKCDMGP
mmetsp:Transcript_18668/g.27698  ORF Transcript_18668/g.27698 Transcript_18668/m.27698 type:complete len:86 (+) Transcript_18668:204-461(+)